MGYCNRAIETNSNEFTVDVHVRLNDINLPHYDDCNDVNETIVGNNNNTRNIQNIRGNWDWDRWTKISFRLGAHRMCWIGIVQVSQHGITTVTCVRLASVCRATNNSGIFWRWISSFVKTLRLHVTIFCDRLFDISLI